MLKVPWSSEELLGGPVLTGDRAKLPPCPEPGKRTWKMQVFPAEFCRIRRGRRGGASAGQRQAAHRGNTCPVPPDADGDVLTLWTGCFHTRLQNGRQVQRTGASSQAEDSCTSCGQPCSQVTGKHACPLPHTRPGGSADLTHTCASSQANEMSYCLGHQRCSGAGLTYKRDQMAKKLEENH